MKNEKVAANTFQTRFLVEGRQPTDRPSSCSPNENFFQTLSGSKSRQQDWG